MPGWVLNPIALTKEKYVTLTAKFIIDHEKGGKPIFYHVHFIDSYQYLATSLDNLSRNLDTDKKVHTSQLRNFYPVDDDILFSKGVFPYSYLEDDEKLDDGQLPPIENCFDMLSNSLRTTPEEYA